MNARVAKTSSSFVVATRVLDSAAGSFTLTIRGDTADPTCFGYEIADETGAVLDAVELFGADGIQALLFCLAAAGDAVERNLPGASFAELGEACLLTSDTSVAGAWRARVSMPTVLGDRHDSASPSGAYSSS